MSGEDCRNSRRSNLGFAIQRRGAQAKTQDEEPLDESSMTYEFFLATIIIDRIAIAQCHNFDDLINLSFDLQTIAIKNENLCRSNQAAAFAVCQLPISPHVLRI